MANASEQKILHLLKSQGPQTASQAGADNARSGKMRLDQVVFKVFIEKVADPEHLDAMRALQPQRRTAEPWEISNVIVFLASDLSGYLTGECISASSQKP